MPPTRRMQIALAGAIATLVSTGATLAFYEESLPTSMNPLYAQSMVDNRVHELVLDRLYYHSPITNELTSNVTNQWELAEGGPIYSLCARKNGLGQEAYRVTSYRHHLGMSFTQVDTVSCGDESLWKPRSGARQ